MYREKSQTAPSPEKVHALVWCHLYGVENEFILFFLVSEVRLVVTSAEEGSYY